MLFRRKQQKNRKRHHAWLYAVVFTGRFSTLAILLLFISFLIQPFHQALANEALPEEPVPEVPVADDVREQISEESPPPTESPPEESPPPPEPVITETPESDTGDLDVPPEIAEEPPVIETPVEETLPPEPDGDDSGAEEEQEEEESADTETATTTEDETSGEGEGEVVEVQALVTEENYYQFNKQSCVAVGDGAYHCTTKAGEGIDTQSVVYAEQDEGGDMEIFLRTSKGKEKQITDNDEDDTAPHYDAESMRVVWQRLIDGRQQIFVYDIAKDNESQLTFSKTNNMEPKVADSGIVWQAWDGNDWEIMLFDGTYTEQITDNDAQDVAPVIQDSYVLWNVLGGDTQQAKVFSLDTKETISINGHEGGSIINPRFVLVYDTEYENGDIVTQTFDPATGLSEPVAAKPAPEPINIPQNDPTGEIRALLMNKSQKDEGDADDLENTTPNGAGTSTPPDTLNLKPGDAASSSPISSAPVFDIPIELTEYDLVIPTNAYTEAMAEQASSTHE